MAPGRAARDAAVALLTAVLDDGRTLDGSLDPYSGLSTYRALPDRDRRLAHAIAATALRRHGETAAILSRLITKPPGKRTGPLMRIIEIAAAQILYMGIADHAAVSTAIDQVGDDHTAQHFKGLANAVLRRLARERDAILADLDGPRLATPDWLWQRWTSSYGETTTRAIAATHLVEPSLDLSVASDAEGWAGKLGGIVLPTGSVRLVPSGPVDALPGFAEGAWWVQDAAAAIAPRLLGDVRGKRVADLCAAPGGKTAALALAGAEVTAVDASPERLKRLAANLARLRLTADTVAADILQWAPAETFEAVLLDAPCTATGTIRRHPDIAWLKKPADINSLSAIQAKMIDRAATFLKPGGALVYCTCSLEPEEGEAQMRRALATGAWSLSPIDPGEVAGFAAILTPDRAVRTLPSQMPDDNPRLAGLDGFFMMRLIKA
ncbi:MAG: transcription antitermination factor NusB [Bauldia sp.]